ncbi:hypothetical protein [Agaribacterium sp. ZY112]|uniref:hypothetical protein n=1 Tax=Agaribacterium sp. ZY112 TaxID=3233574 RepID=UPI0035235B5F
MYLATVTGLAIVLGGLTLFLSIKIMKRFSWFLPWIRGCSGLLLLIAAVFIFIAAFDLSSYDELLEEKALASISFEQIDKQYYRAHISYYIDKPSADYEIYGDQWQIDARIVRWTGVIAAIGAKPGIELDRISGRYYSLEEERMKPRSVYELSDAPLIFDAWKLMQEYNEFFPGVDAVYGSATFLPMADKAHYQLSLSHNGLSASPSNEIAKKAVQYWR